MNEEIKKIFIKQMLLSKEELAMQTMELMADKMDLQSKIDNAIEYIEKEKYVSADENCEIIAGYHIDELLDILKERKK